MGWWTKSPLWARVMAGLVLGAILGLAMHGAGAGDVATTWFKPFGDAFVRLIRMLVVPLIFATLVAGMVAMGDPKKLGSLGGRAVGLYMITTLFAVSFGLLMGFLFQPGVGVEIGGATAEAADEIRARMDAQAGSASLADRFLAIIPLNPVAAMASGDVLAIIFFAIIFGVGILLAGQDGAPVARLFESASDVMIRVTEMVMQVAPIGVFALMTWIMATQGLGVLDNLLMLAAALYAGCLLHILVVYGGLVRIILGLPLVRFFRGMADALAVAYSTSSSSATLPVTIACATDNLGIRKPVAASVLPLGSTVNMDGTALYQGVVAMFAAQAFGVDLTLAQLVMIALTATLVSIGTAGIPSVSLFLAFIVLDVIGVRGEDAVLLIAMIFPFDRLLDMMRTVTNVTGDAAVATAVAKWQGELDEDVFRSVARM